MVTIYGVARSRASRPLWLLGEIGMDFAHVPVIQAYRLPDPAAADAPLHTAAPAYLAINPQGQVPCMTDGDLTLTESLAITLYLATRYGGTLGPQDAAEAALIAQWTLHAVSAIESSALEILQHPDDAAVTSRAIAALRRPMARLEGHLAGRSYLVAERFTVADINVAETLRYAQGATALWTAFPLLSAWIETVQARPAFKAMWAQRMAEPA
ncbi:MAG: glutathione S-transferase family protein [Paracoccaceae bacterium]